MSFPIKIDKTISVGNILTILSIVASMLYWGSTVESRLSQHDLRLSNLDTKLKAQEDTSEKRFDRLESLIIQLYRSPQK